MQTGRASRTAERVARRRAAHQVLDQPAVFHDPLALRIVGEKAASIESSREQSQQRAARSLRAFVAVRSRYAEDQLAAAVEQGIRRYIILGAGLDTFAYRNPFEAVGLRVFEVDHPATQMWKRERLAQTGVPIPSSVTFAPVNFEHEVLEEMLTRAGLRPHEPAFFSWLGVTPYLTRAAFEATAAFIAQRPATSVVSFDYAVSPLLLSDSEKVAVESLARRVESVGEPFQLYLDPAALQRQMHSAGFTTVEDLSGPEINARYFAGRSDGFQLLGNAGRLLTARN